MDLVAVFVVNVNVIKMMRYVFFSRMGKRFAYQNDYCETIVNAYPARKVNNMKI